MYAALGMLPGTDYEPGFVLQTDFDNGGSNTDAFNFFFDFPYQLGTGTDEDGSTCFGDSGGAIYNQAGEVTGVNSYVISLTILNVLTSDVTPELDCSFGEFTGHTRVSSHTTWIDSIIAPIVDPPPTDPITCGTGTTLNTSTNECEADPQPSQCASGTTLNTSTNECEADPQPSQCASGTTLNTSTNECEADPQPSQCASGTTLNTSTNECELDVATIQILADVNTLLTTNNCSPMATTIGSVLICIDDLIGPPPSPDVDNDSFTVADGDCNDNDPTIYPGAVEIVDDGIDQDCNGSDLVTPGPSPDVSIGNVSFPEGTGGSTSFVFTVTRSGNIDSSSSVNYATSHGDTTGGDYSSKSGTVTFAAGDAEKTITISVRADKKTENNETFNVHLSSPIDCTISDDLGVGTIINDD